MGEGLADPERHAVMQRRVIAARVIRAVVIQRQRRARPVEMVAQLIVVIVAARLARFEAYKRLIRLSKPGPHDRPEPPERMAPPIQLLQRRWLDCLIDIDQVAHERSAHTLLPQQVPHSHHLTGKLRILFLVIFGELAKRVVRAGGPAVRVANWRLMADLQP